MCDNKDLIERHVYAAVCDLTNLSLTLAWYDLTSSYLCVLAAVIEQLIGNRLADTDIRNPDLHDQHLTADRAFRELDQIRQVTFTAGGHTITAVTRRNALQQQILDGLGVDTRDWAKPTIHHT